MGTVAKIDFINDKIILFNEYDKYYKILKFAKKYILYISEINKPKDTEGYNLMSLSELKRKYPKFNIVYTNKKLFEKKQQIQL